MWVLSPMIGSASQHAAEEGTLQNPVQFLGSGAISIGRPTKKGGTTGKADLLIFGESSVSTLHAKLTVAPWDHGTHGQVCIEDDSKYGTFVKQQRAPEQRIPAKEPFQLQAGDILRFGTKCRYKLQQVAINLCVTGTAAADPQVTAAAAACSASIVDSCNGGAATHCVTADGDVLTPAVLYSLLNHIPVITPQWLTTVAAGKVYAQQLPDTETYTPKQLLIPSLKGEQQNRSLDVLNWQMPSGDLLAKYQLIFPLGRQEDLVQAAKQFCPDMLIKNSPLSRSQLAAEEQPAAATGRAAVLVLPAAAPEGAITTVSEQQLLCVMVMADASSIQAAVDTFRQQQQQQQKQPSAADSEDLTEVEEADEGVINEDESQLQAVMPVIHSRKQQQQKTPGRLGKGKSPAKSPAGKQPLQLETAGTPNRVRGSKRAAASMEKAAAPAADKTPPGRKRRKTAAVAAADQDELEFVDDPQQQAMPQPAAAGAATAGATWHSNSVPAGQHQRQQQPLGVAGTAVGTTVGPPPAVAGLSQLQEGIYVAPLVVAQALPAAAAPAPAAAGDSVVPTVNFKVFRRKENLPGYPSAVVQQQQQADGQQQENGQQQQQQVVVLVEPFDAAPKGVDVDAFLKDERARLDRLKKADELFNANLKPKTVAKSTGAGAAGSKPPAKRKAR